MDINYIISKKKNNKRLNYEEIQFVVINYVNGVISDDEMTIFLKLICKKGLSYTETFILTDVMLKSGDIIDLGELEKISVDKHSTGGIGDKVSLIVGPIVASSGLVMAKMSGKGLGYTGGTIDKLKSIPGYKTELEDKEFMELIKKTNLSIISQTKNICPADKKIYALRDVTGTVNSIPLIASSIMSKKIASGARVIVIDLKVGKGAFMKNIKTATMLANTLIKIGNMYSRKVICILTDMNTPIGKNIGNKVEVEEVIDYFNGNKDEKLDVICKTISAYIIKYGKNKNINLALKEVNEIIDTGKAKSKFYEWISLQGGNLNKIKINSKKIIINSDEGGYIKSIDALNIGKLSCSLGAGRIKKDDKINYDVGVKLNVSVGDYIKKGDKLATVYYDKRNNEIEQAIKSSIFISKVKVKKKSPILKVIK